MAFKLFQSIGSLMDRSITTQARTLKYIKEGGLLGHATVFAGNNSAGISISGLNSKPNFFGRTADKASDMAMGPASFFFKPLLKNLTE